MFDQSMKKSLLTKPTNFENQEVLYIIWIFQSHIMKFMIFLAINYVYYNKHNVLLLEVIIFLSLLSLVLVQVCVSQCVFVNLYMHMLVRGVGGSRIDL